MTSRSRSRFRRASLGAVVAAAAATALSCSAAIGGGDAGLEGLSLSRVDPGTVVPGTVIVARGTSFVGPAWGDTRLRLIGTFDDGSGPRAIDAAVPARFVNFDRLEIDADDAFFAALGGDDGTVQADAVIEVDSAVDGELYATEPLPVTLDVRRQLTPSVSTLQDSGLIFVNDAIYVEGGGYLLGGSEGTTVAIVEGCFTPEGDTVCTPVGPVEVPVVPETPFDRTRGAFAFSPEIAGIRAGSFDGTVALANVPAAGTRTESGERAATYDIIRATVFSVSPTSASLGQFVDIEGGGFVGNAPGASTLIRLTGTFTPTGAPGGAPVDLLLVPEFVDGRLVRYVVNEDDTLGQALDLRTDTGTFTGDVTPIVSFGGDEVTGDPAAFTLAIAPVKQIVYLQFRPSFVESLRHFGLRAVDARIRERIAEVVRRDFETINLEVRTEEPTDFALYSVVEISGPDPNGLGLFGYDNTPGKDTDNERLYDRIGGVNATTQEDGYPGYGGVFIESLFGFSMDPGDYAEQNSGADAAFDEIFDPFRPDQNGDRVAAADLSGGVPTVTDGSMCPADDRETRIACAVFVLGSLIGSTVSHEIGHSLGLANPYGQGFHNQGDEPDRLMDAGASRPFTERAELYGDGPSVFCDEEYDYLRQILPTSEPDTTIARPSCL